MSRELFETMPKELRSRAGKNKKIRQNAAWMRLGIVRAVSI